MEEKDLIFEQTLADSEQLLKSTARDMDEDAAFSLESILAEYGEKAPDGAPQEPAAPDEAPVAEEEDRAPAEPEADVPKALSLEEVLKKTVQDALDEHGETILEEPPQRRGLFSRKKQRDTEQLYDRADEPREEEPAPEVPEPSAAEVLARCRAQLAAAARARRLTGIVTALLWGVTLLSHFSLIPAEYSSISAFLSLALALFAVFSARRVFLAAGKGLREKTFRCEALTALFCAVTLFDTAFFALSPARAALSAPLPGLAVLSLYGALLGETLSLRGACDTFRIAALGEAPYMVTVTALGAAKHSGETKGFVSCALARDPFTRWQGVLLPVIAAACLVFSALATLEAGTATLAAWELSVLLASANLLAFPLSCALPYARISARLAKSGSAVAGFAGAEAIRRSNCMILTDGDLFPPGTVTLSGLKVFGEESGKVISYAASMAHAAESGLSRLFDNLLESDGGTLESVDAPDFFEEGGIAGRIHGETVLFGTAGFLRKQGVALPRNLSLKTGVFLSVDGSLIAVFAVKYLPAENVDWALHALHHSRITPVLAVRDGNITPALLKRKFGTDARAVYPKLSTRLALSEGSGGRPCALLMREGLMPYAEAVLGSKRLCRCARRATILSFLASVCALLIAFYLTFSARYSVLSPLALLVYVLLWSLCVLVDGVFADRY